jgi:predicted ATP-grasp superfamily ATP-dependent carboligase
VKEFSQSFAFLNLLISTHLPVSMEEMVAAALRRMSQAHEDPHAFLVAAGKELALLLSGQFNQLKAILGRLK